MVLLEIVVWFDLLVVSLVLKLFGGNSDDVVVVLNMLVVEEVMDVVMVVLECVCVFGVRFEVVNIVMLVVVFDLVFFSDLCGVVLCYLGLVCVLGVIVLMVMLGWMLLLVMEGCSCFNLMVVNFLEGYNDCLVLLYKGWFIIVVCDSVGMVGGMMFLWGCLLV